jgi:hypothetical protein
LRRGESSEGGIFIDTPQALAWFDFDGITPPADFLEDPINAIDAFIAPLIGDDATYAVQLTSTCGLVRDGDKWLGYYDFSHVRFRLFVHLDKRISCLELAAWSHRLGADPSLAGVVQPVYVARPLWMKKPGTDILASTGIPTCWLVKRDDDVAHVPDDLQVEAQWWKREGKASQESHHHDADAAILAIGSDGIIYPHLKNAARHMLKKVPFVEGTSMQEHAVMITQMLRDRISDLRDSVVANLVQHGRNPRDVEERLRAVCRWTKGSIERGGGRGGNKLIRRKKVDQQAAADTGLTLDECRKMIEKAINAWRQEATVKPDTVTEESDIECACKWEQEMREAANAAKAAWQAAYREWRESLSPQAAEREQEAHGFLERELERLKRAEADTQAARKRLKSTETRRVIHVIKAPTGSGKSHLGHAAAADLTKADADTNVLVLVPNHQLSAEQENALIAKFGEGIAAVWRGRDADDPLNAGEKMCLRPDDVKAVLKAGGSANSLCGTNDRLCPYFGRCGYQRQKAQQPRIWIGSHELLKHPKPEAFGKIKWIFIDENCVNSFLFGVEGAAFDLAFETFDDADEIQDRIDVLEGNDDDNDKELAGHLILLSARRSQFLKAIEDMPDGPLAKLPFFTEETCRETRRLEWKLKIDPCITPEMDSEKIIAVAERAAANNNSVRMRE